MSNMFTLIGNTNKENGLQILRQFVEALEGGAIELTKTTVDPSAHDKGLCDHRDTLLLAFAYRPKKGAVLKVAPATKAVAAYNAPATTVVMASGHAVNKSSAPISSPVVSKDGFVMPTVAKKKLTDREAEGYRAGREYVCKCGKFKTDSVRGFKKHFNRCQPPVVR